MILKNTNDRELYEAPNPDDYEPWPDRIEPGTVVAYYRVRKATVVRKRYEVAAWWTDVEVDVDGEWHPISKSRVGSMIGRAQLPGRIVDDWAPALFGGVPVAGGRRPDHIGRTATVSWGPTYDYTLAAMVARDTTPDWIEVRLADGIETVEIEPLEVGVGFPSQHKWLRRWKLRSV